MLHHVTAGAAKVATKAAHKAPHAEHAGFVAYAFCEVASIHGAIYLVSIWLFVTGLLAIVAELKGL